jgi:hypothetical protein
MNAIIRSCVVGVFAFSIAGCWSHSYPDSTSFIRPEPSPAELVHVFVDANGTFYPSGWDRYMERSQSWGADSLLNESNDDPPFRAAIEAGEREQVAQLREFGKTRGRIFVLVHGYNNTMQEAEAAFRLVEAKLAAGPADGIVRFYWDGLTGSGIGGGKIWFNAAGYSQLAGSRGLRRVFDSFAGKEIYVISHSRGASVVLSALGNPVYDPRFLADTEEVAESWGPGYENLTSPAPLSDNGNTYHILALAPAIDRIDFCDASEQPDEPGRYYCNRLRSLARVESFRYTVNSEDPVLNKFVGLSAGFNPTGLGTNPSTGQGLAHNYTQMKAYPLLPGQGFHGFSRYIASPAFDKMLEDAEIRASD